MTFRTEAREREIEEGRSRLGRTIGVIQDRLSLSGMADEALRHGQVGSVVERALNAARRNPIPILLVAAGAGWLMHSMRKIGRKPSSYRLAAEAEDIPVLNTGNVRIYDPDVSPRHPMHDSLESRREMSARI